MLQNGNLQARNLRMQARKVSLGTYPNPSNNVVLLNRKINQIKREATIVKEAVQLMPYIQ